MDTPKIEANEKIAAAAAIPTRKKRLSGDICVPSDQWRTVIKPVFELTEVDLP